MTTTTQKIDPYPHGWATLSRNTKRSRKQGKKVQCSCCGKFHPWDHVETHHSSYQGENDQAGVNIFPICGSKQDIGTCHHWVHEKENWIQKDDVRLNHNIPAIVHRLQRGYAGDKSEDGPWLGIAAAIGVVTVGWFVAHSFSGGDKPVSRTAIVTAAVNVRQCPAVTCPKAGRPIAKGASVDILEEQDGWLRIGDGRWISDKYTKR